MCSYYVFFFNQAVILEWFLICDCAGGVGLWTEQLHVCLSRGVKYVVVRVPEPFALMFSFQDWADGRKRIEHFAIRLWCLTDFLHIKLNGPSDST